MRNLLAISGISLLVSLTVGPITAAYADEPTPKFDCAITDQKAETVNAAVKNDVFTKTTPIIYLICDSQAVEKGQVAKAVWIADDTHNAAPANYKIAEKSVAVPKKLSGNEVFSANMSLSKPDNGWPVGSYHVDFYFNDKLNQSLKFTVK